MRFEHPATGTKEYWYLFVLRRFSVHLNAEETGWMLGFTKKEITALVAKKILKFLGTPTLNRRKIICYIRDLTFGKYTE